MWVCAEVAPAALESGEDTLIWSLVPGTWARSELQKVAKAKFSSMVVNCRPSGRTEVALDAEYEFAKDTEASRVCGQWCSIL